MQGFLFGRPLPAHAIEGIRRLGGQRPRMALATWCGAAVRSCRLSRDGGQRASIRRHHVHQRVAVLVQNGVASRGEDGR